MPRRKRVEKRKRTELTIQQLNALLAGDFDRIVDAFCSYAAAREAWEWHRDDLISKSHPGRRPNAFWVFETEPELWPLPALASFEPNDPASIDALVAKYDAREARQERYLADELERQFETMNNGKEA